MKALFLAPARLTSAATFAASSQQFAQAIAQQKPLPVAKLTDL